MGDSDDARVVSTRRPQSIAASAGTQHIISPVGYNIYVVRIYIRRARRAYQLRIAIIRVDRRHDARFFVVPRMSFYSDPR